MVCKIEFKYQFKGGKLITMFVHSLTWMGTFIANFTPTPRILQTHIFLQLLKPMVVYQVPERYETSVYKF